MGSKKLLNEIDRNRELMGLSPLNENYEDLPKINDTYSNITFADRTKNDRLPKNLLDDIQAAAKHANITVQVDWAKTDHRKYSSSGNISRHWYGYAVDLSHVNGKGWSSKNSAKKSGIYDGIESFVKYLKSIGYKVNSERGNDKAVLYFGFPSHDNHLHVSNKSSKPSDGPSGTLEDEPESSTDSTTSSTISSTDVNNTSDEPKFWDIKGQIKKKGEEIKDKILKLLDYDFFGSKDDE